MRGQLQRSTPHTIDERGPTVNVQRMWSPETTCDTFPLLIVIDTKFGITTPVCRQNQKEPLLLNQKSYNYHLFL